MNASPILSPKSLTVTHVLAELLERLEHSRVPVDAGQYLSVVEHLVHELGDAQQGAALGAILDTHPAAAEIYENLHYQHAGLCRSGLDASLAAEQQALEAIHGAMNSARLHPSHKGSNDEQS